MSYVMQNGGMKKCIPHLGLMIETCQRVLKMKDARKIPSKEAASYLLSQIASNSHSAADLVYDNFGTSVTSLLHETFTTAKSKSLRENAETAYYEWKALKQDKHKRTDSKKDFSLDELD